MANRKILLSVAALAAFLLALGSSGCADFNQKTSAYRGPWDHGDVQLAAIKVVQIADQVIATTSDGRKTIKPAEDRGRDALILLLEEGSILRAAAQYDASNKAFILADEMLNLTLDKPSLRISDEIATITVNGGVLPYEGFAYDHVMATTYMALNYLQLGDSGNTRKLLKYTEKLQRDYLEKREGKIESRKEELTRDHPQAKQTPRPETLHGTNGQPAFADLDKLVARYSAYQDYRNPFSTWLYGIQLMWSPADTQDIGAAQAALKIVAGMVPGNTTVVDDLARADTAMTGASLPPTTYVVFETGLAPIREEFNVRLPIPTGRLDQLNITYAKASFPVLKPRNGFISGLSVTVAGQTCQTQPIANLDAIIAREFKDELPLVITRAVISTVLKAAATDIARRSAGNNDFAQLLILGAGIVFQEVATRADLRQWTTLPKEFQVCSFPTPADRTVVINSFSGPFSIKLIPGDANIVFVKSIQANAPLLVWQAKLK